MTEDYSLMVDRRKKVDDDLMRELIQRGLTNAEIVRTLLSEYGIKYSAPGVTRWKTTHGLPVRHFSATRKDIIPWRVLPEHASHRLYRALHAHARLEAGLEADPTFQLPREERQRRAKLVMYLDKNDAVIHYDQVNGFAVVPARHGIDTGLIRDPRIADDGTKIENEKLWQ
jgi:hypothetical protein